MRRSHLGPRPEKKYPGGAKLLKEINQRLGLTDRTDHPWMDVIRTLCDRVAVLERGEIIEQGEVASIWPSRHEVTQSLLGTLQ